MPHLTPLIRTGKVVEWDRKKGYGFLLVGEKRLFLHVRDFAEQHKRPEVGDRIQFLIGEDFKGRTCAKNAVHVNDGGRIRMLHVAILLILLVLPAISLWRAGADFRWVSAYALLIGGLAYGAYALDKHRARTKEWRLSEGGLHLLELAGGWPGAFLAQKQFRHKCSKASYQAVFWLIVLIYQFLAVDSFQDWKLSRAALHRLQAAPGQRK